MLKCRFALVLAVRGERFQGADRMDTQRKRRSFGAKEMDTFLDHPEVQKLIRELVACTGESPPEAVARALQERLERERKKEVQAASLAEQILAIGRECASLPVLDSRTPEEILGYNEQGIPD